MGEKESFLAVAR